MYTLNQYPALKYYACQQTIAAYFELSKGKFNFGVKPDAHVPSPTDGLGIVTTRTTNTLQP